MAILKQAEAGLPIHELYREQAMSSAPFYKWWTKIGGMDASIMTRMKGLKTKIGDLRKCMPKGGWGKSLSTKPC